jgi:hypothetical protein
VPCVPRAEMGNEGLCESHGAKEVGLELLPHIFHAASVLDVRLDLCRNVPVLSPKTYLTSSTGP